VCLACLLFVPTPQQMPQLRSVDAFAPLVTAILLAWIPVHVLLLGFAMMMFDGGMFPLLLHNLVAVFAYFGILMLTAPEAYDEAKRLLASQGGGQQAWGAPQGQWQQPPPQGQWQQPPPQGQWQQPPPQGQWQQQPPPQAQPAPPQQPPWQQPQAGWPP